MPTQYSPFREYETGYPDKHLVMTPDQFGWAMRFLEQSPVITFDFETSGLRWFKDSHAIGIGLSGWDNQGIQSFYVPFRHRTGEGQWDIGNIGGAIGGLLADERKVKVGHNLKFDMHFARREGWQVRGRLYDTMIAARLFDENRRIALKVRAQQDLGRMDADEWERKVEAAVLKLSRGCRQGVQEYRNQHGYEEVPIPLCGTYCCLDVEYTTQLFLHYERVGISHLHSRIWNTEMGLLEVLCDMEEMGLPIDVDYLEALRSALGGVLESLELKIQHQLGGQRIQLGSDDEVRKLLLSLGCRLTKRTRTKALSVDREVLEFFSGQHPVIPLIMEWRDAEKISSTYTNSILSRLDAKNVLHADFQQVGTNTGRLSCREPNFQNQPTDNNARAIKHSGKSLEDGGVDPWSIRRAYVNRGKGWMRQFWDYSQIELRVLAFYSRDPVMVQAYLKGEDIHSRTSQEVFGTTEKSMRRMAKIINFGLCIAEGQKVLTKQSGEIPIERVQDWHLVWDGVEWVPHDGLVCRGVQEVTEYEGVVATPDHQVYTEDGRKVPIGHLASKVCSGRLAVGAVGGVPVRYVVFDRASGDAWAQSCGRGDVWRMPIDQVGPCPEHQIWKDGALRLSTREVPRPQSASAWAALRRYGSALQARYAHFLEALQGAWNSSALQIAGAFRSVGVGDISEFGLCWPGVRPYRQRWELLSRESSAYYAEGQCQQRTAVVYDLLNAGPRKRFTVSGKIVSNSYCMTDVGFARQAKIPQEDAARFLQKFFERYQGVAFFRQAFWQQVRSQRCSFQNLFGRPRRVPGIVSPDKWERGASERQAIATLIQGTAAELTKESLVRIHRFLKDEKLPAYPVSTVHDEVQIDCQTDVLERVARGTKALMEDFPEFNPIPIVVDGDYTVTSWAEKRKLPT